MGFQYLGHELRARYEAEHRHASLEVGSNEPETAMQKLNWTTTSVTGGKNTQCNLQTACDTEITHHAWECSTSCQHKQQGCNRNGCDSKVFRNTKSVVTCTVVSIGARVLDGAIVSFLWVRYVLLMYSTWVVPIGKTIVCQIHLKKKVVNRFLTKN